jgi:membrane protein required for beta-lactamase induction
MVINSFYSYAPSFYWLGDFFYKYFSLLLFITATATPTGSNDFKNAVAKYLKSCCANESNAQKVMVPAIVPIKIGIMYFLSISFNNFNFLL